MCAVALFIHRSPLCCYRNCLFRALALQLGGDRLLDHTQLRRDVVHYMREHRDEFEPFIEDQTSFEQYGVSA